MTSRRLKLLAVATFAAASSLSTTGAAVAAEPEPQAYWYSTYDRDPTDGDAGGVSIMEEAIKSTGGSVSAKFRAHGEHLLIWDNFNNDRATIAKLWVGGSGPAVFYSEGDFKAHNLSYDEGQKVYLQVCTSDHPNAVCTDKKKLPGVS